MYAPPECEGGVHLVLDLDEGVEDHGPALVEVDVVLLHPGLVAGLLRVPPVNGELLGAGGLLGGCGGSGRRRTPL